jgi:hypothetical protein
MENRWIDIQQRLLDIQQNPVREPMKSILGHFIFINQHQYIDKIVVEEIIHDTVGFTAPSVTDDEATSDEFRIPFSKVLQMIQSKKYVTSTTKYVFKEVSMFHIDLEPEHIQSFVNDNDNSNYSRFFRVLPSSEDIVIPASIFIFHSVNALYFLFQEIPLTRVLAPKPILKKMDYKKNIVTKKVHIAPTNITRKHFSISS